MSHLDSVIDTGMIEAIHRTVVSALERNLYRPPIGRFAVHDASGQFHVGRFTEGRRVLILPDTIERYELHLRKHTKLVDVPGAAEDVDDVGFIYDVTVRDSQYHRGVEVSFHYPRREGDDGGAGRLDLFGFELIQRKMTYDKPERGRFTPEIFGWIHKQLTIK